MQEEQTASKLLEKPDTKFDEQRKRSRSLGKRQTNQIITLQERLERLKLIKSK